ncbi:Phage Gp37Gp68, partial [mine drainage metagenome]
PLLGLVALERVLWPNKSGHRIDWVVVGGESGAGARPMQPEWARTLRDECAAARVPYYFKQCGEWAPAGDTANGERLVRIGKRKAGSLLDGVDHKAWPQQAHAATGLRWNDVMSEAVSTKEILP